MSSRVLSSSKLKRVEAVHWLTALGEPVNAPQISETGRTETGQSPTPSELESAMQRVHVLERRIHELELELPRRYEKGKADGRAEGEQAGAATGAARVQTMLDRMAATIAELGSYRARFRRDSEPELLQLAMAVAKKILRRELTVDPHSLLGILKAALDLVNRSEVLAVRMAPEDATLVSEKLTALGLSDPVEVIGDRTLERGSVLVDTKRGQIDASVQTQLAEIENGFADRIAAYKNK